MDAEGSGKDVRSVEGLGSGEGFCLRQGEESGG